ncbi:MAG TPA: hypothetical protein VFZ00_20375 [Solirubrobacter sp.]|nr:hypothetical protein [Solirubrobacter sp.]
MLVVLAVMGVMVLAVTVSPPNPGTQNTRPEASSATPDALQLSDAEAFDVTETLSAAPGAKERTIEAELGDRVEIVVEGNELDSVALGDLFIEPLDAGVPARFQLLAQFTGSYPLVLIGEDRRIGSLEIR